MAIFKGMLNLQGFPVDKRVDHFVRAYANCIVPIEIIKTFHEVTWAIAEELASEEKLTEPQNDINCLFLKDRKAELSMEPGQLAICMCLVFYPVETLIRCANKNVLLMLLTEELCHLIWNIRDEIIVNDKVLSVLKHLDPDLTLESLGYIV